MPTTSDKERDFDQVIAKSYKTLVGQLRNGITSNRSYIISGGLRLGKSTLLEQLEVALEPKYPCIRMPATVFLQQLAQLEESNKLGSLDEIYRTLMALHTAQRRQPEPPSSNTSEPVTDGGPAAHQEASGKGQHSPSGSGKPRLTLLVDDLEHVLTLHPSAATQGAAPRQDASEDATTALFEKALSRGLGTDRRYPVVFTSRLSQNQLVRLIGAGSYMSSWITNLHPVVIDPWRLSWRDELRSTVEDVVISLLPSATDPADKMRLTERTIESTGGHPALVGAVLERCLSLAEYDHDPGYPPAYVENAAREAVSGVVQVLTRRVRDLLDAERPGNAIPGGPAARAALRQLVLQLVKRQADGGLPKLRIPLHLLENLHYLGIARPVLVEATMRYELVSPLLADRLRAALTDDTPPVLGTEVVVEALDSTHKGRLTVLMADGTAETQTFSGKIWSVVWLLAERGEHFTPPDKLLARDDGHDPGSPAYVRAAVSRINGQFTPPMIENEFGKGYRFAFPVRMVAPSG